MLELAQGLTYAEAGVDIPATQAAIKALTATLTYARPPGPGARVESGDFFTGMVGFGGD